MEPPSEGEVRGTKHFRGAEGNKGIGKSNGRGGSRLSATSRRQRPADDPVLRIADPNVAKVLSLMMKQTARNTQDMRLLKPAVLDIFQCRRDSPLVVAVEEEKDSYIANQRAGKPPEGELMTYQWLVFMDFLSEQDIGLRNKAKIKEIVDVWWAMPFVDLEMILGPLTLETMQDTCFVRILLGMHNFPAELRSIVIASLRQLDMVHKPQRAPPGYMETQLSRWIEDLSV